MTKHHTFAVNKWIVACCNQASNLRTKNADLYASYCLWCEHSGLLPIADTAFGRILSDLHFLRYSNGRVRGRFGIGLKASPAMPPKPEAKPQPVWFGTSSDLLTIIRATERGEPCPNATPELLRILKEIE